LSPSGGASREIDAAIAKVLAKGLNPVALIAVDLFGLAADYEALNEATLKSLRVHGRGTDKFVIQTLRWAAATSSK
jgi:hypothetical protein